MGLHDWSLNEPISKLTSRWLALMEDIEAPFFRGLTRKNDIPFNAPEELPSISAALDLARLFA